MSKTTKKVLWIGYNAVLLLTALYFGLMYAGKSNLLKNAYEMMDEQFTIIDELRAENKCDK